MPRIRLQRFFDRMRPPCSRTHVEQYRWNTRLCPTLRGIATHTTALAVPAPDMLKVLTPPHNAQNRNAHTHPRMNRHMYRLHAHAHWHLGTRFDAYVFTQSSFTSDRAPTYACLHVVHRNIWQRKPEHELTLLQLDMLWSSLKFKR